MFNLIMTQAEIWKKEITSKSNPEKAKILSGFFKTGKGQYGEGDIFLGLTVPQNREIAKKHFYASFDTISELLQSPIHEFRISALFALVIKFKKHKEEQKRIEIVKFYLSHTYYINNWDLVDLSCGYILGEYMLNHPHDILIKLSNSKNMWEQRIAIVSTITLIRNKQFDTTLYLAEKYLNHTHDLIHKATGWMLREMGKQDADILRNFLNKHAQNMPRTTLRYAIEKFTPEERKKYLSIKKQKL